MGLHHVLFASEGREREKECFRNDEGMDVRDVVELLEAKYIIFTGGRYHNGCSLLTFPDNGNFCNLSDEEYQCLVLYLTSIPSRMQEVDQGFVLVIDRRSDKWNSVKTVLLKISVMSVTLDRAFLGVELDLEDFFPGLINVAYVLRPASFLQKALSEVSSKIFKDEFKFRVVVCNYLEELHEHIDTSQLTADLGGDLPYCHEDWLKHRVALEKFSSNTKTVSVSLDGFTHSLEDTEFPNDVDATQQLLKSQNITCPSHDRSHEATRDQHAQNATPLILLVMCLHSERKQCARAGMFVDVTLDTQTEKRGTFEFGRIAANDPISLKDIEGRPLYLNSLNLLLIMPNEHSPTCCARDRRSLKLVSVGPSIDIGKGLIKLLVQLEETERTFDEFWQNHSSRLRQCLELRMFEQDFKDLQSNFDCHLKTICEMTEVGETVARVDTLLREMKAFQKICKSDIERAEELIVTGQQLLSSRHHGPLDCVQPKCSELERMCTQLFDRLRSRFETLTKCRELQERIEKANKWCACGIDLLASQQMEKCWSSAEQAEQCLADIQCFIASAEQFKLSNPKEFSGEQDISTEDHSVLHTPSPIIGDGPSQDMQEEFSGTLGGAQQSNSDDREDTGARQQETTEEKPRRTIRPPRRLTYSPF
uniref:CRAL-TRIO domain-containing protein n=1 Tax=Timema douglasi TaxID=61478 RepID=A0A7R8ZAM3_TIMDO|nr:unnamed protein product [Timema douglasi]